MKEIIINDKNLDESSIEKKVTRVKGLIINSHGKILLCFNNNTYQFPGGHLDENENRDDCIVREIIEETGIHVIVKEEPFLCIRTYEDDYYGTGKKILNEIYYYRFLTDSLPNYEETHFDEFELATDFDLFYIEFSDLKTFLMKCIDDGKIETNIGHEMIHVVDTYNELFGGKK